ncbi:MAG: PilN domain-containing protein [Gammaproteobacteria bacterium]|nr:PilN domain-containing protein [Gammaproteobacteria bacterium]
MAKINLLPWRQERRREQQRQFLTLIGLSGLLVALLVFFIYLQYNLQIGRQQSRNKYLTDYVTKLKDQIKEVDGLEEKKELMVKRIDAIQDLQRSRPDMVHLFDELVRIIPEGVYLISLKQNGNNLDFVGMAQSNSRVSSFMRNIDQSMWFQDPQLISIEEDSKGKEASIKFTLTAKHVNKAELASKDPKTAGNKPVAKPTPAEKKP